MNVPFIYQIEPFGSIYQTVGKLKLTIIVKYPWTYVVSCCDYPNIFYLLLPSEKKTKCPVGVSLYVGPNYLRQPNLCSVEKI